MIDFTPGEICLGVFGLLALVAMWRILTTDDADDTEEGSHDT